MRRYASGLPDGVADVDVYMYSSLDTPGLSAAKSRSLANSTQNSLPGVIMDRLVSVMNISVCPNDHELE
jgi:hypothetical protein